MNQHPSPQEVVDRQLRAYNARDVEAYCALYSADATVMTLNDGTEHARGIAAVRAYYADRFSNSPDLHCEVTSRMALGNFVVDRESVTGIGRGPLEVIAIYEVIDSRIRSLRLIRV